MDSRILNPLARASRHPRLSLMDGCHKVIYWQGCETGMQSSAMVTGSTAKAFISLP